VITIQPTVLKSGERRSLSSVSRATEVADGGADRRKARKQPDGQRARKTDSSRRRVGHGRVGPRTTQRKPTWLVEVSTGSACRAAGR
jgi:hypothetical protein